MGNLSELAMDLRIRGTSVDEIAEQMKVTTTTVSRVCNGRVKSKKVEMKLIKLGCSYLLKKVQVGTGIFDQERFDKMVEDIKGENNGKNILR